MPVMEDLISNPLMLFESSFLNESGHLIQVLRVDLRVPEDQTWIGTLIKGGMRQHAIERGAQVRLSTQAHFRESGKGLIRDASEAFVSRTEEVQETVDDPYSRLEVQLFLRAIAETSEQLQLPMEITSLSTTTTRKTTDSVTHGRHGWIFSTSIEPTTHDEWSKWWESLPDSYNHVSRIERPREFAGALGSMLAEQVGPRGNEENVVVSFDEQDDVSACHPSQLVVHGPVVYVEDPYESVADAPAGPGAMFRSVFVKGIEYQDQREYRFVMWSEDEPARDVEYLTPSMTLLGSMDLK